MTAWSEKRGRIVGRRRRSNWERFVEKCRPGENGCVEFSGWKDKDGYAMFCFRYDDDSLRDIRASHAALMIFGGKSVPPGDQANHRCDNRGCVNHEHLFIGDQQDNIDDMVAKGRHAHGEKHTISILDEDAVRYIRKHYRRGNASDLAEMFGVSRSAIGAVIRRQNWDHVK